MPAIHVRRGAIQPPLGYAELDTSFFLYNDLVMAWDPVTQLNLKTEEPPIQVLGGGSTDGVVNTNLGYGRKFNGSAYGLRYGNPEYAINRAGTTHLIVVSDLVMPTWGGILSTSDAGGAASFSWQRSNNLNSFYLSNANSGFTLGDFTKLTQKTDVLMATMPRQGITANGEVYVNGFRYATTVSGTTAASTTRYYNILQERTRNAIYNCTGVVHTSMMFRRQITRSEAIELSANPWQAFRFSAHRIYSLPQKIARLAPVVVKNKDAISTAPISNGVISILLFENDVSSDKLSNAIASIPVTASRVVDQTSARRGVKTIKGSYSGNPLTLTGGPIFRNTGKGQTYLAIFRINSSADIDQGGGFVGAQIRLRGVSTGAKFVVHNGSGVESNDPVEYGKLMVVACAVNATTTKYAINGNMSGIYSHSSYTFTNGSYAQSPIGAWPGYGSLTGEFYGTAVWDRMLTDTELMNITSDPWQLFSDDKRVRSHASRKAPYIHIKRGTQPILVERPAINTSNFAGEKVRYALHPGSGSVDVAAGRNSTGRMTLLGGRLGPGFHANGTNAIRLPNNPVDLQFQKTTIVVCAESMGGGNNGYILMRANGTSGAGWALGIHRGTLDGWAYEITTDTVREGMPVSNIGDTAASMPVTLVLSVSGNERFALFANGRKLIEDVLVGNINYSRTDDTIKFMFTKNGTVSAFRGVVYTAAILEGALNDSEALDLSSNPWQMFKPDTHRVVKLPGRNDLPQLVNPSFNLAIPSVRANY